MVSLDIDLLFRCRTTPDCSSYRRTPGAGPIRSLLRRGDLWTGLSALVPPDGVKPPAPEGVTGADRLRHMPGIAGRIHYLVVSMGLVYGEYSL